MTNTGNVPKSDSVGSIAVYIIASTCVMFLVMSGVIVYVSYHMYQRAFYDYSNSLCLSSNAQAAFVIDGDLVEHYAKTLTVDERYEKFAVRLDELKHRMRARYFYILVDNGVPGMYTYIYDATHSEEFPGEKYALGRNETVDEYDGAAEVLATGKGFDRALYYNDRYGELYYAYSPIFNSQGKAVAFVGTDIDIEPLHTEMYHYRSIIVGTLLFALTTFSVLCFVLVKYVLSVPMQLVLDNALRLAQGDLNLKLPPRVAKRNDEIGELEVTFETVAHSISGLILDIGHILQAAQEGRMGERADLSDYRGDYHRIILGVNTTLEAVCRHFDAVPEAIAFFGPDGRLLYGNRVMRDFAALFGLDTENEDFLSRILSHADDLSGERVRSLFGKGDSRSLTRDVSFRTEDGEERGYALSLFRAGGDGEGNDASCVMMLLTDVTQLIRARDAAESANRAKSDFLSRMSHEIRTPMNAIIGLSQIARDSSDMEKIRSCLRRIESSSTHLLGIINDILDLSKIEAGRLVLNEEEFSLSRDLDFVMSLMVSRARERGISLESRLVRIDHDFVVADSLRLNQVLLNLLSNAVKFSADGGKVELSTEEIASVDGWSVYRFVVRDYGIGIDGKRIAHLFRPFEQADAGVSRKYGGTGLGLVISKNLVEMMGGEILLESGPGKGTSVTFTIRCRSAAVSAGSPGAGSETEEPGTVDFSGRRALIVDDIEINREIIIELLKDTGLEMDSASDGREAVEKFNASPVDWYDIILMDMQMPVLDGCEATAAIRASGRPDAASVKIVAMTANVMKEDVDRALASGMNGHTGKPVDIDHLIATMERLMGVGRQPA